MTSFTVACPLASSHAPAPANRGGEFEFAHGNRLHLQTGAAARSVHAVQDNTGIGRKFRADDMPPSSSTESVCNSQFIMKSFVSNYDVLVLARETQSARHFIFYVPASGRQIKPNIKYKKEKSVTSPTKMYSTTSYYTICNEL